MDIRNPIPDIRQQAEIRCPEAVSLRPLDWLSPRDRFRIQFLPFRLRAAIRTAILVSAFVLLAVPPTLVGRAAIAATAPEPALVHFCFAKSLFSDVNENDAKAAVKVYAQNIADENGIVTGDNPLLLDGTNAIAKALQLQQVDVLALGAEEFFALESLGLEGPLLLSTINQSLEVEYVLLARETGAIRNVEDLKGRSLIFPNDVQGSLARPWLEVLCREHGLGPASQGCARITPAAKATQVVLPVYFGKADACIVTRFGWEVMGELNPQVKKQLRVIAVSPPVVPTVSCFRRGLSETLKQRVIQAAEGSSAKPAFQQLMALFKTDGLCHQPVSSLKSTRDLVARYHQLCAGINGAKAAAPESAIAQSETEGKGK
jgi:phosphonate transport system substrate-binding protein